MAIDLDFERWIAVAALVLGAASAGAQTTNPGTGGGASIPSTTTILKGVVGGGAAAPATANDLASLIQSATGCTTAGYVWSPSTNTCVAAPSAAAATSTTPGSVSLPTGFAVTQLSPLASTPSADNAATSGANGIANLLAGTCAAGSGVAISACDVVISPAYSLTDFSRYFTPAKQGNDGQYELMATAGGMGRSRLAEDHRLGNRYFVSMNPFALENQLTNERSPFVFVSKFSNSSSYADNLGTMLLQNRIYYGHNYNVGNAAQKQNFLGLALDGQIRSGGQGGGYVSSVLNHTSPGDDIANVVQHDTNGCAEGEDECDKLWRAFLETTTVRWGGTLNATPTIDTAGFGNYSMQLTVGGGYSPQQSGTEVFTVNLSNLNTAGNVVTIGPSSYPGLAKITGDSTAAWASTYGASVETALTAPIDAQQYNGSCPSTVVSAGPLMPDPFNTDENGVGGITQFCVTVASTSGFTTSLPVTIVGNQGNIEMAKVVAIVDATHMTINAGAPHASGETIWQGGAQGYGISMIADDMPSIFNYFTQPTTTLHKFFPIAGSDSSGNLYAYTNAQRAAEISTNAYQVTAPTANATIGSISTSGTSVTAVNLSSVGNYRVNTNNAYNYAGYGYQATLAAPTLTWTGCTTPPTTVNTVVPGLGGAGSYGLQIVVTNGGNCSSPSATLSTTWANPYRIAPLVMAKKVMNPATGSANDGYLMTGMLNPAKWPSGSLVEQPGWVHDFAGSQVTLSKYYTGSSRSNGILNAVYFAGDYAFPDTLNGFINNTDGHKYYASASQPLGPGVAYEQPPNGLAMVGDYNIHFPIYTPPLTALFDIGCGGPQLGNMPYNPCLDNIYSAYNIFQARIGSATYGLRFDPTANYLLSWNGPFTANAIVLAAGTTASGSSCTDSFGFTHPANSSWDDDNYHYHCLASGTSAKRVALSAF